MKGFTLIETVIIIGVLGVIMVATTNILVNSFRAKNRVGVADVVEKDGDVALRELKENVIVAAGVGISCAISESDIGSTLALLNTTDGVVTNLVCYEGSRIASESANGSFRLTSTGVGVSGCDNFARCELFPDSTDRINLVNFSFTLAAGDSLAGGVKYQTRNFRSSVVPRN